MVSKAGCAPGGLYRFPFLWYSLAAFTPGGGKIPWYFRSLKGSLLLRRSLVLSLSRHILQRGIHESSLCTACQRFAVNLPPSAVPRPGFNCLHDKRTSRKVVHIRRTFHPFSGQKKEEKQLSTFFVDFPVGWKFVRSYTFGRHSSLLTKEREKEKNCRFSSFFLVGRTFLRRAFLTEGSWNTSGSKRKSWNCCLGDSKIPVEYQYF